VRTICSHFSPPPQKKIRENYVLQKKEKEKEKMKKIILVIALVCLLSNTYADDSNSSDDTRLSTKLSDSLEQGAVDIEELGALFLDILSKGVNMLKAMTDIAISNPIVFIGLLLEIVLFTYIIGFFAAGWAVQNWIPIIGAIVGVVSYPHFLNLIIIPLLRLVGA